MIEGKLGTPKKQRACCKKMGYQCTVHFTTRPARLTANPASETDQEDRNATE